MNTKKTKVSKKKKGNDTNRLLANVIIFLDNKINGEISVTKLSGLKKKLKAKSNVIQLKRLAKEINYSSIRF